jgi:hypothetical protein
MTIVLAVLLAAGAGSDEALIPGGRDALRSVRVRAANAVWLADIEVKLDGEFIREKDGERIGTDVVASWGAWGSAFAVSAGGDLLTNRHVADPRYLTAVACRLKLREYASFAAASARVRLTFTDVAGTAISGRAVVTPSEGPDVCVKPLEARWRMDDDAEASVIAIDDATDLALVRLEAAGIAFLRPDPNAPKRGTPVAALGYDGQTQRLVRLPGAFHERCAAVMEEEDPDDVFIFPQPEPLTVSTAPVRPGMSGGPLVTDDGYVAVSAKSDVVCDDDGACDETNPFSHAVPGPYADAWYRWVTGASPARPTLCVPDSFPFP